MNIFQDRWKMFFRQFPKELEKLGLQSLPIVAIISIFIGFIMTMQTKLNTSNPLLPVYTTGLVTRDTLLLEFSSTILCLILAGKVGSNIASEIGTMRITEQIDALEIPDPSQNSCLCGDDAFSGDFQHGAGLGWWLFCGNTNEHPDNRRLSDRYTICLYSILCVLFVD